MHTVRSSRRRAARACAAGLLLALFATSASVRADAKRAAPADATYAAECGSCHLAYPPRLLSAASWSRVMRGLDKHFGSDAGVDAASFARIDRYLREYAGPERKFGTTALRISETDWFRREHDEVPAGAWKSPAVKSAASCGACHVAADKGDYSERSVRVPRF